MAYWLYNILPKHSVLEVQSSKTNAIIGNILVENKKEDIPPNKGDQIITLGKNGELIFEHFGEITEEVKNEEIPLSQKEISDFRKNQGNIELPKKYKHTIPVRLHPLHEKFDDYIFSLLAIENIATPYNHFKNKYTRLKKNDFETVVQKMLYISRTTFGRLFNALPLDMQLDCLLSLRAEEVNRNKLRDIGFFRAIDFLKEYIELNVVDTGNYLVKIDSMIENDFVDTGVDKSILGFSSDNYQSSHNKIELQAAEFRKLFDLKYDLSILDVLQSEISKNKEVENRFNSLFSRRPWPIRFSI